MTTMYAGFGANLPTVDLSGRRLSEADGERMWIDASKADIGGLSEEAAFADRWLIDNVHGGRDPRVSLN